jgi:DNA-binding beta-propeller fold protein YncE
MIFNFVKPSLLLFVMAAVMTASWLHAAVEISLENTLRTESAPIDIAVSKDGRSTFVLTEDGSVALYDNSGKLTDTIKVGAHIDQIEIGPRGERLFATSRQNKTVEILLLNFIYNINTEGSAIKGPADAPVTIAVFSEFQ